MSHERDGYARDLRQAMRMQLSRNAGIDLGPPTVATVSAAELPPAAPIDRWAIRKILMERGAPARDLQWLTDSCPSTVDAEAYTPPRTM